MPDNYDVGGIEAHLIVDTSQFTDSVDKSEQSVDRFTGKVASLSPALQKLEQEEERLSRKYTEQQKLVASLDAALDDEKIIYAELLKATNTYTDSAMDQQFAKEAEEVRKAQSVLDEYAQKIHLIEQKKKNLIATSSKDQSLKDAALGVDTLAQGLRTLSPALGDAVGNASSLAQQVLFLKKSMQTAASAGAAMGAGIVGGIGLAVTAISMIVQAVQNMEAERQKAYDDAISRMQEYESKLDELRQKEPSAFGSNSTEIDLSISSREDLISIFPDIILGYDNEGNAIYKNNQQIQENIDLLNEQEKAKRNAAVATDKGKTESDYFSKKNNYDDKLKQIQEMQNMISILENSPDANKEGKAGQEIQSRITYNKYILENLIADSKNAYAEITDLLPGVSTAISNEFKSAIDGYDQLDNVSKTVADSMISDSAKFLLTIDDENRRSEMKKQKLLEIQEVLGNTNSIQGMLNLLQKENGTITSEQIKNVTSLQSAIKSKLKSDYDEAYKAETDAIKKSVSEQYEAKKASLNAQYEATETAIKAEIKAYQSLKFDITSLDEDALNQKKDLLDKQLQYEVSAQERAAAAVKERYYEEARLIVETANKEIATYKAKIAALDAADKAAEDAKKSRQNQSKVEGLNSDLAKQQQENDQEMSSALADYEKQRTELQAIIDAPPSKTAQILAQRELQQLNEDYAKQKQKLESEHAEKIKKIRDNLNEELLSQQEEAAANERDAQRDALNGQIDDVQSAAEKKLSDLNNSYTAQNEAQQASLNQQLSAEETYHQQSLASLSTWQEETLASQLSAASDRHDALVNDANLDAQAMQQIMGKSYDDLGTMMDQFGIDAEGRGVTAGQKWANGFSKGSTGSPSTGINYGNLTPSQQDYYLNYPKSWDIPAYASGGIVTSPTLALIGEGGEDEAVLPMSKLRALVQSAVEGSNQLAIKSYQAMLPYKQTASAGSGTRNYRTDNKTVRIDTVIINKQSDETMLAAELGALLR